MKSGLKGVSLGADIYEGGLFCSPRHRGKFHGFIVFAVGKRLLIVLIVTPLALAVT